MSMQDYFAGSAEYTREDAEALSKAAPVIEAIADHIGSLPSAAKAGAADEVFLKAAVASLKCIRFCIVEKSFCPFDPFALGAVESLIAEAEARLKR